MFIACKRDRKLASTRAAFSTACKTISKQWLDLQISDSK